MTLFRIDAGRRSIKPMKGYVAVVALVSWSVFFFGLLWVLAGMGLIPWLAFWVTLVVVSPIAAGVLVKAFK